MIFAFSTSSRLASVAVFRPSGETLWSGELDAPQSAGSACFQLLETALSETGASVQEGTLFVADVGPGSFTGVRVGIVLAKTLGFLYGTPCAGIDAFDLIDSAKTVCLPLKRGEFFVRHPGEAAHTATEPPPDAVGYGPGVELQTYPLAVRGGPLLARLIAVSAQELVPRYLVEPSISLPKRPFSPHSPSGALA